MADATASPGTITRAFTTPAAKGGAGSAPAAIAANISTQVPGVVAMTDNHATVHGNVMVARVTSMPTPSTSTVEYVEGTRLTFKINIGLSLTSQLLGYGRYAQDGSPPQYTVIVMTPGGTKLAALDNAEVSDITWVLNGADTAEFTMPAEDTNNAHIKTAEREVQIWRGPDLMFWGVVVRAKGNQQIVTYQCVDLSWYFTRRVVGAPETNYITNGSFEAGFESWIPATYAPTEPGEGRNTDYWVQEIRDNIAIDGSKSLYQWGTPGTFFGIKCAQMFEWTVDANLSPEGDTWNLVAWCYIPSEEWVRARITPYTWEGYTAPTGISFVRLYRDQYRTHYVPGVGTRTDNEDIELVRMTIDESTPKDTWVRLEAPLTQPVVPGQAEIILVLLETPIGGIYWDNISLVRNERLYYNNVDQATIIQGLVQHAQNPAVGKSDLNIGTNCPPTGVLRTRIYEYFNHQPISECIDEWPGLWDGMDWSIELTQTTRTFTSWYPRKGTRKPKYALVLGKNIARVEMAVDGEQTSNRIIVMADKGEGAAREEAVSTDASTLTDGLILEKVYTGTPGASVNTLQAQADRGLRRYKDPVKTPTLTTFPVDGDELLGMIVPGDVVPVDVRFGWFDMNEDYRIVKMSLDPRTEQLAITVNPEVNWSLTP